MERTAHHRVEEVEEVEDMAVRKVVMEARMGVVAGAVEVDSEVVVAAAADMTAVLTEVAEVDREGEEAWGKCLKLIGRLCC